VVLLFALICAQGCASTKIDSEGELSLRPLPRPVGILVYDFAFRKDQVSPEAALGARLFDMAQGEELTDRQQKLGEAVAQALSETIVSGLNSAGLTAQRVPRGQAPTSIPASGVLKLEGQFVDIDAGNRARRIAIGLGVGKSQLATAVQLFDSTPDGDLMAQGFSTTARSDLKPGALVMAAAGPVGGGVGGATGVRHENKATVQADARRTGNLIVSHLITIAYQRGWVSYDDAKKAHADIAPIEPDANVKSGDTGS
jgi:hypothetical protein